MCTTLSGLTTFVYLASWAVIIFYMVNRNMRHIKHVLLPVFLILLNATLLVVHLDSSCNVNYIKTGAATEAVLLFILLLNVSDCATEDPGPTEGPD